MSKENLVSFEEILNWKPRRGVRVIRSGESLTFEIRSSGLYQIFEGEEDLSGNVAHYSGRQMLIYDAAAEEETVLVVQKTLAYEMINMLSGGKIDADLTWDRINFKGSRWEVTRKGKYDWDVRLLSVNKKKEEKEANTGGLDQVVNKEKLDRIVKEAEETLGTDDEEAISKYVAGAADIEEEEVKKLLERQKTGWKPVRKKEKVTDKENLEWEDF